MSSARVLRTILFLGGLVSSAASCGPLDATSQGGGDTTSHGGTGGGGGTGGVTCDPADCPPPGSECGEAACNAGGTCGEKARPDGTLAAPQVAADCKKRVCQAGAVVDESDDADVPDDGNECTDDVCSGGVPSSLLEPVGSPCGAAGTLFCDGSGTCSGCLHPGQCPGQDTECQTRTCDNGACGLSFAAAGAPVTSQTLGDCNENQCTGNGSVEPVADDTDPDDDGNACTADSCNAGVKVHSPAAAGAPCGVQLKCDGAGSCVGCVTGADCGTPANDCLVAICTEGTCTLGVKQDGVGCDDKNACTQTDACQAGRCSGETPSSAWGDRAAPPERASRPRAPGRSGFRGCHRQPWETPRRWWSRRRI
jgi:hypothetical protein